MTFALHRHMIMECHCILSDKFVKSSVPVSSRISSLQEQRPMPIAMSSAFCITIIVSRHGCRENVSVSQLYPISPLTQRSLVVSG